MKSENHKVSTNQCRTLDSQPCTLKQPSLNQILQSKNNNFNFPTNITNNIIQKINNDGSGMTSTEQDGGLVIGATIKDGPLPPMTLHHIIPRERLSQFWNAVKAHGHINYLIEIVESLTASAIRRDRDMLELDLEGGARLDVGGVKTYMNYMHDTTLGLPAKQNAAAQAIQKIFQWWPANIHYGPTSRVTPVMKAYYNEERDDGGNDFEKSAKKVVAQDIFSKLEFVNNEMVGYLADNNWERLQKIKTRMIYLATKGSTPYDAKKWKKQTIDGRDYYRFQER